MTIPSNLADAAAAVRDGEFGLIEDIKIGDLIVSALTGLDGSDEMTITEKPVEAGYNITDAAIKMPARRSLDIVLANPSYTIEAGITAALSGNVEQLVDTWREKKKRLYQIFEDRELVTLQTHEDILESMLIQSITPLYDLENNLDAFVCNVQMQQVFVSGEVLGDFDTDYKKKSASKSNAGRAG